MTFFVQKRGVYTSQHRSALRGFPPYQKKTLPWRFNLAISLTCAHRVVVVSNHLYVDACTLQLVAEINPFVNQRTITALSNRDSVHFVIGPEGRTSHLELSLVHIRWWGLCRSITELLSEKFTLWKRPSKGWAHFGPLLGPQATGVPRSRLTTFKVPWSRLYHRPERYGLASLAKNGKKTYYKLLLLHKKKAESVSRCRR